MDLGKLDLTTEQSAGAWLTLRDPRSGDDLPIRLRLAGAESKAYRDVERSWTDRAIETQQRQGRVKPLKAADLEARGHRLLAAVVMAWEMDGQPYLVIDDKQYACNAENAKLVFARFPWIAAQCDEFIRDPANFGQEGEKKPSLFDAQAEFENIPGNLPNGAAGAVAS